MGFAEAVRTVFSKFATFSGRARRSEYWWWYLFLVLVNIVGSIIFSYGRGSDGSLGIGGIIFSVLWLAVILPTIAVSVRRLHDTGKSGWWLLIGLVPLIGFFVLLYFFVTDSEGDNQYGRYPKDNAPAQL